MNNKEKIAILLSIVFSIIIIMTFTHLMTSNRQTEPEMKIVTVTPFETPVNITDSDHFAVNGNYQEVNPVTVVKQPVKTEIVYQEPEREPVTKTPVPPPQEPFFY